MVTHSVRDGAASTDGSRRLTSACLVEEVRLDLIDEVLDSLTHRVSLASLRFLGGPDSMAYSALKADFDEALATLRVMSDLLGHRPDRVGDGVRKLDWPNSIADGVATSRHLIEAHGAAFTSRVAPKLARRADLAGRLLASTLVQLCRDAAASGALSACDVELAADAGAVGVRMVVHGPAPGRPSAPALRLAARMQLLGGSVNRASVGASQVIDVRLPADW